MQLNCPIEWRFPTEDVRKRNANDVPRPKGDAAAGLLNHRKADTRSEFSFH